MRSPLSFLRKSLAVRTASIILLMVAVVGLVFLALAVQITRVEEHQQQMQRLDGLLNTVHSTVSIATFLQDRNLASELVAGLLRNPTVRGVRIYASGEVIAEASKNEKPLPDKPRGNMLIREIESPFGEEIVGRIMLLPDETEIRAEVGRATRYTSLMLTVLLVLIGIGIIAVVVRLITRPILQISNRLHGLRAETGEKLDLPRGSETDEIGRLVNDVNALIDYLVNLIQVERDLRVEREVAERKFRTIFDNAETGMFVVGEDGRLYSYNPAFARLFGLSLEGESGSEAPRLEELFDKPDSRAEMAALVHRCRTADGSTGVDFELLSGSGRSGRWVHVVLNPVEGSQLQGVVNDITQRKRSEMAAQELAVTDALSGLQNRLGFERRLDSLIEMCERHPEHRFSLLMLDLDHFKQVNDTYGHEAGDRVLQRIAELLQANTRKTDFVARLGGDEFVVLLDGNTDPDSLVTIANNLIGAINEPIDIGEADPARVGVSIGIARYRTDSAQSASLMRQADEAMYRAKMGGRNTYRFGEGDDGQG